MIDSMRVEMILINLISNAIKFSRHDSQVKLKVVVYPTLTDKAVVEVRVTDSGIGIPDNELKLLFQPFFRSTEEEPQKIKAGGHGIGLYNCKMLAEFMGGSISVVSEKSVGSTFILKLVLQTITSRNSVSSLNLD